MRRWKITYPGRRDSLAKSGYAAASWHTFDKRVWKWGPWTVTLTNLRNTFRQRGRRRPRITVYCVTLTQGKALYASHEGFDWQRTVRGIKEIAEKLSEAPCPNV
jgi:hypothetical protein